MMINRTPQRVVDEDTKTKQKIVSTLYQRVIDEATGSSRSSYNRYPGESPESLFWLGMLSPEVDVEAPNRPTHIDRLNPASQGLSFCISSLPTTLNIALSFNLWVNLHPTHQEQINSVNIDGEASNLIDNQNNTSFDIARIWAKVPVEVVDLQVDIDIDDVEGNKPKHVGRETISRAIHLALDSLPEDFTLHQPLRRPSGTRPGWLNIKDATAWRLWEGANLADPTCPKWVVEIDIEVRHLDESTYEILVTMVNRSPNREAQYQLRKFDKWACQPDIYEAWMRVDIPTSVVPYRLEQIPDIYRYDRNVEVLGWNTAAKVVTGGFETDFVAIAETERVWPREHTVDGKDDLDTRFKTLIDNPLPALDRILDEADVWVREAWRYATSEELANDLDWRSDIREQVHKDSLKARDEIEWVRSGVNLLKNNKKLLRAFRLMNETMERVAGSRYNAWRPFQLAFIIGCLPSILDPENDDNTVDILWFPTGGGKTEAYLGLSALILFYGRITGRTSGCQIWARFPLRLLSLQQTQRFAEMVLLAESVRIEYDDIKNGAPFGVGYLVGVGNTPNRIELPDSRFYKGWDPFLEHNTESCRVLEFCPVCNQRPLVRFDRDSYTMEHRCETSDCSLFGLLPVYVIDDDVERRAPAVIVGTVDKLTKLSWSNGFRHLLGASYGYCDVHGLSRKKDQCAVWSCDRNLKSIPSSFGGLELEIQDEMHLLSESLGALDGNYETLFQAIASECGITNLKIIGATATIEGYREQSEHLYKREPRRFPLPGPTRHESFWSYENKGDPLRIYVALLPRKITMLDAAFRITRSLRSMLDLSLEDTNWFCSLADIDTKWKSRVRQWLINYYYILTVYALRKTELIRYQSDVMDNPSICPEGSWESITGDTDFWSVRDVLKRLDNLDNDEHPLRILGATAAISHGVDVDRLNVMCMMGMPNQVSEFIQATSRVGRIHPGLVFCLINPMRERDVSCYRYFKKWADYLDKLVEHVPVNRESLQVLQRVISGGFMAWILQVLEPAWLTEQTTNDYKRLWYTSELSRVINNGRFNESDVIKYLLESFAIDSTNSRFARHQELVKKFVRQVFQRVNTINDPRESLPDTLESMGYPVPRSLRDVDTIINIRGDW